MLPPPPQLKPVGLIKDFQDSHRYVLSWRSWRDPSQSTSILIYRFETAPGPDPTPPKWYGISNECPHLGAPLEQGPIEIEDLAEHPSAPVIICPWHNYDFSLDGGHSPSTGLRACVYAVEEREGQLWVEPPGEWNDDWRLLGTRAVSERFADEGPSATVDTPAPSYDLTSPPATLVEFCRLVLLTPDPTEKVRLTRALVQAFRAGQLQKISSPTDSPAPDEPPRTQMTVPVGKAMKIGKGASQVNRVKMMHALASIELWAIDLAIDVCCRFANWKVGSEDGKTGKRLPMAFFADFLKVAEDEAKHYTLLVKRMRELGTEYGDYPVHAGLWESATETSHSLFSRLAIIHLVHEARGLDTNPRQIARCRGAGDHESAETLTIIHNDEITHVAAGHRHFRYLCANLKAPVDPIARFKEEVAQHFYGNLKGPFNVEDRKKAGIDGWYEDVKGRAYGARLAAEEAAAAAAKDPGGLEEGVAALNVA